MVECGACSKHFEVADEVIVKSTPGKFYPGERNQEALGHFQRVPGPSIGVPAATPVPRGAPEPSYYSPISRVAGWRIGIGWLGALVILGVMAILIQAMPGTAFVEISAGTQLVLALAGGAVGLAMITFANPRTWKRTLPIAAVFTLLLLAVPFVFRSKLSGADAPARSEAGGGAAPLPPGLDPSPATDSDEELRARIGTAPLDAEITRLAAAGGNFHAYGIWLRDLPDSYKLSVRDYIQRATGADPAIGIYARDARDYLMMITGVTLSLEDLSKLTVKFAREQKVHSGLSVVEVKVDSSVFIEGPLNKLNDKGSTAFYDSNKRELESIQLERVGRAVKRLAEAEPKIFRQDITRQLILLVSMEQVDFVGDVCRALLVWAEDPSIASDAVLTRMQRLYSTGKKIPREMVVLLARTKTAAATGIVEDMWVKEPVAWETLLGDFGPVAEPGVLARFPKLEGSMRYSAVRILTAAGTLRSLPALSEAKAGADPELAVLIEEAEKAIKERGR